MTDGFADITISARVRDAVERIAKNVVKEKGVVYRYGSVTSIDYAEQLVHVQFPGSSISVPVKTLGVQPTETGQIVQVAAADGDHFISGVVGTASIVGAPAADLTAPNISMFAIAGAVVASWNNVANAASYEVQFAEDAGFTTNVSNFQIAGTSFTYYETDTEKDMYARVRALSWSDPPQSGPWSTPAAGPVSPLPDAASVQTDGAPPADSPDVTVLSGIGYLQASWPPQPNADPVTYEVHISTTTGFTPSSATLYDETTALTNFIQSLGDGTKLAYNTTYFVRIVAKDADGAAPTPGGQDSAQVSKVETADAGNIGIVNLSDGQVPSASPAVGSVTGGIGYLYVTWDHIANDDPVSYEVHLSTTNNFPPSAGTRIGDTPSNYFFIRKQGSGAGGAALQHGISYYIKIIAKDADGYAAAYGAQGVGSILRIVTADIGTGQVTATGLASNSVNSAKITSSAVTTAKIAADAVTAAQLADNAVGTEHIQALAVTAAEVADSAIITAKLAADAVTAAQLADDAVGNEHIQALAISAAELQDSAVTTAKILDGAVTELELAANAVTEAKIAADAITSAKIADGAVGTLALAADAVTNAKIAVDAITATEIADGAVGTLALAADAVTAAKIATDAVTSDGLAPNAVTTDALVDAAITAAKLGNDSVTADAIAAATITAAELADGAVSASKLNVSIGGGNLLSNSSFEHDPVTAQWSRSSQWSRVAGGRDGSGHHMHLDYDNTGGAGTAYPGVRHIGEWYPPVGTKFVLSAWGRIDPTSTIVGGTNMVLYFVAYRADNSVVAYSGSAFPVTTEWTRVTRPYTVPADTDRIAVFVQSNVLAGSHVKADIDDLQLEQGDVATAYAPKPDEILPGTITTTEIADDSITTPKLVAGSVVTAKLAADAVTANELAANAVYAGSIQADAVGATAIAADAVTAHHIAAGTITAAEIAADTITGAQIAANTITASEIAANTITAAQVAANTLTAAQIAAGAIATDELAAGAVTAAKITSGTITSVQIAADTITAGNIAAGAITASELAANSVVAGKIAADAVTANEIAALTITAAEIAADAITTAKIDAGAVTAAEIAAGTITALQIAADTITGAQIAATTITAAEIASGAITTAKLDALAVTADKIAANTITAAKIAAGTITSTEIAADTIQAGNIAANAITASEIAADAVTTAKIDALAVTASEIAAGAIETDKLAANAVTAAKIAAGTITANEILAGTITGSLIAADTITGGNIAAATITGAELVAGTITATQIASSAISTAKLAANAVTAAKIAANTITAAQINTGAITADELAASAVTATKIAAGAITADMIAAGTLTSEIELGTSGKIQSLGTAAEGSFILDKSGLVLQDVAGDVTVMLRSTTGEGVFRGHIAGGSMNIANTQGGTLTYNMSTAADGGIPTGWTGSGWQAVSGVTSPMSGKILRLTETTGNIAGTLTNSDVGDIVNFEALMCWRALPNGVGNGHFFYGNPFMLVFRRSGANWYEIKLIPSEQGWYGSGVYETRIAISGATDSTASFTVATGVPAFTSLSPEWTWMRVKVTGSLMYAKAWLNTQTEPAGWSVVGVDSSITDPGSLYVTGTTGDGSWTNNDATQVDWDYFEITPDVGGFFVDSSGRHWGGDPDPANSKFEVTALGVARLDEVTRIAGIGGGPLRIETTTGNGWVEVGPANTSAVHFYTDRSNFYFDKNVIVNGNLVRYQEGWTNLSFGSGWSNYSGGGGYATCQYRKLPDGTVEVRGLAQRTGGSTTVGTLPVGYRPASRIMFATIDEGASSRVDVSSTGAIIQSPSRSTTYYSLSPIRFYADG